MPRRLPRARGSGVALGEAVVVGNLQQPRKHLREISAVVGRSDRRLVGHGLDRHEIAPPDLGAVDPEHARRLVGEPLQHVAGFRPAGAAIGVGRHRVGEHAGRLHGDRRRAVDAGEQRAVDRARDGGAEGRDIGAEIGDGVDAEREEMPLARRARARRGSGDRGPGCRRRSIRCGWRPISPAAAAAAPPRRRWSPPDSACPCSRSRRRRRARPGGWRSAAGRAVR